MPKARMHKLAGLLPALMGMPMVAHAGVLDKEKARDLCTVQRNGERIVDVRRLASYIVGEARIPPHILDELPAQGGTPEGKYITLVRRADSNPFESLPPNLRQQAKRYADSLLQVVTEVQTFMIVGHDNTYTLVNERALPAPVVADLFDHPDLYIKCAITEGEVPHPPPPASAPASPVGEALKKVGAGLRVRGSVKDLSSNKHLRDLDTAKIGVKSDQVSDTQSFNVAGVVGYEVKTGIQGLSLIPYVDYKKVHIAKGKGTEIEYWAPGLMGSYFYHSPMLAYTAALKMDYPVDEIQQSEQLKLRASLQPSFRLAPGQPPIFGSYFALGNFYIRPDIELFVEGADVVQAGSNKALTQGADYYGAGFDFSARLRLNSDSILSKFSLIYNYKYMSFFAGDIALDDIFAQEAVIEFQPPGTENYVITGSYKNGQDFQTFQRQDLYTIGVGIRF